MKTLSRNQAIGQIREALLRLVDDEHSLCQVAAEKHIYCHGVKQWTDSELERRLDWLVKIKRPKTRAELEEYANRWMLQRQEVLGVPISCDVQQIDRDQCCGWDQFDDVTLAQHYRELFDEEIQIA